MSQSAYIKLVDGSAADSITLEEVKTHLHTYIEQTTKTGQQLEWSYEKAAFPYTIASKPEGEDHWFYLEGQDPLYQHIIFGVGSETDDDKEAHHIQVVLPDGSTHGDKSKAIELCKYLANKLKAELHLFNRRVMYFNPRK